MYKNPDVKVCRRLNGKIMFGSKKKTLWDCKLNSKWNPLPKDLKHYPLKLYLVKYELVFIVLKTDT